MRKCVNKLFKKLSEPNICANIDPKGTTYSETETEPDAF